ncbi:MAG: hypothetical protein WD800_00390, partial [Dehalococcoidia bacterium]
GATAAAAGLPDADLLRTVIEEGYASVRRTPDLLPRLREAGVVDSGGAGVAVLIEGIAHGLGHAVLPDAPRYSGADAVTLDAVEHEGHGYCTEFVVAGEDIDRASMERSLLDLGGDSTLVVGDARTVHVHVHMEDPGPAISLGAAAGALLSVKVENMQAQHEDWMAGHDADDGAEGTRASSARAAAPPADLPAIGLVAVAGGAGIASAFRDLGATGIVDAGDGTKASAGELLEAARRAGRDHVIILPNDKDVLMAAETCASEAGGFVSIIPTRNAAAGLAAAVSYRASGDHAAIAEEMTAVLEGVRCVEVSVSVRDATVDGVAVLRGEAIAFVDGRLVASDADVEVALMAGLAEAVDEASEIVTVYLGDGAPADAEERVTALIADAHPGLEVDVLPGGQPHYPYLVSVE